MAIVFGSLSKLKLYLFLNSYVYVPAIYEYRAPVSHKMSVRAVLQDVCTVCTHSRNTDFSGFSFTELWKWEVSCIVYLEMKKEKFRNVACLADQASWTCIGLAYLKVWRFLFVSVRKSHSLIFSAKARHWILFRVSSNPHSTSYFTKIFSHKFQGPVSSISFWFSDIADFDEIW